ncbi:MAG: hypothetical protein V7704_05920 [Aurantimonas endophytica]|uniref:hypothetical protein n=1 Tax=Aurantimonas endophytica TaxID=1522175 RepID=UPI0030023294
MTDETVDTGLLKTAQPVVRIISAFHDGQGTARQARIDIGSGGMVGLDRLGEIVRDEYAAA